MYQRDGAAAYRADLNNTIVLCNLLNNPQDHFKTIHVAGTNGKGSVSHMLAAILQQAGYNVGLYTSPHLKDYRERIKINGNFIAEDYVVNFVNRYKGNFDEIKPSFFEITVALAFNYFYEKKVDIAIIEVGMGGRLDSTNVISPMLSIITNISFDHQQFLGNTLQKIAIEKAGIIKEKVPIIIGETQPETETIFKQIAKEKSAPLYFADQEYTVETLNQSNNGKLVLDIGQNGETIYKQITLDLTGDYQLKNILSVLKTIELLKEKSFVVSNKNIFKALAQVKKLTGLEGRWQIMNDQPLTICDVAHNIAGVKMAMEQLQKYTYDHLHIVLGMVNDKDVTTVIKLLPKDATYYFSRANIPRGLDVFKLEAIASKEGLKGKAYSSVKEAYIEARKQAQKNDLIYIGGSCFVVGEVL